MLVGIYLSGLVLGAFASRPLCAGWVRLLWTGFRENVLCPARGGAWLPALLWTLGQGLVTCLPPCLLCWWVWSHPNPFPSPLWTALLALRRSTVASPPSVQLHSQDMPSGLCIPLALNAVLISALVALFPLHWSPWPSWYAACRAPPLQRVSSGSSVSSPCW